MRMTHEEILDYYLRSLDVPVSEFPDWTEIRNKLDVYKEEMYLMKLKKDGYTTSDSGSILTLEGKIFIENGGYVAKAHADEIANLLKSFQTWILVIGTGSAGLYALIQFFQWFFSCHH